jgi:carbon storage regulator CsrA
MLTLTRRPGEKLILETSDGPIEVVLNKIDGQQAKIGIAAPDSVIIRREELMGNIQTKGAGVVMK